MNTIVTVVTLSDGAPEAQEQAPAKAHKHKTLSAYTQIEKIFLICVFPHRHCFFYYNPLTKQKQYPIIQIRELFYIFFGKMRKYE